MLAVLLPSRGLIRTRVIEALENELHGIRHKKFYTHAQPIPDCFNHLSEAALAYKTVTHLWFVEEDVVPPPGSLKKLLGLRTDIAFVNYPIIKFPNPHCYKHFQGILIWVGLGCTLVRRRVFTTLEQPWFKANCRLKARHSGSASKDWTLELVEEEREYGGQDIYFCTKAREAGYTMGIVPDMNCDHDPVGSEGIDFYQREFKNESNTKARYVEQVQH